MLEEDDENDEEISEAMNNRETGHITRAAMDLGSNLYHEVMVTYLLGKMLSKNEDPKEDVEKIYEAFDMCLDDAWKQIDFSGLIDINNEAEMEASRKVLGMMRKRIKIRLDRIADAALDMIEEE